MGGGGVGGSGGSGDDGTGGFLLSPLRAKKKLTNKKRKKRISSWVYKDDAAVGEKIRPPIGTTFFLTRMLTF